MLLASILVLDATEVAAQAAGPHGGAAEGLAAAAPAAFSRALAGPRIAQPGPLRAALAREGARLQASILSFNAPSLMAQTQPAAPPKRNWIQRHPILFCSTVGFATGFLIGANGNGGDEGGGIGSGLLAGTAGGALGWAIGSTAD